MVINCGNRLGKQDGKFWEYAKLTKSLKFMLDRERTKRDICHLTTPTHNFLKLTAVFEQTPLKQREGLS
jgi:hypothetical protein